MRLLLTLLLLTGLSANAQPLWRNFWTTNQNPRVTVVAGSNATVQASTIGVDQRIFTVNGMPSGADATNGLWTAVGVATNQVYQSATNTAGTYKTDATNGLWTAATGLTNVGGLKVYGSNVVSGGQVPIAALSPNAGADGWFLVQSNSAAVWGLNGASLTNVPFTFWTNYTSNPNDSTNLNGLAYGSGMYGMTSFWSYATAPGVGPIGIFYNGIDTNTVISTNGGSFSGRILDISASASAPISNQLVTASWVRNLFNTGAAYYNSTNIQTGATNADMANQYVYSYQSTIPISSIRTYTATDFLTNNGYVGAVVTTNTFSSLAGTIVVNAYLAYTAGGGASSVPIKPEIYISSDRTNWYNEVSASSQNIASGTTNLYQWLIDFPSTAATNAAGFYVQRRFKVTGTPGGSGTKTLYVFVGTNAISGTADAAHLTMQSPTATAGNAYLANSQVFSGSNTFTGTVTASRFSGTDTNNNLVIGTDAQHSVPTGLNNIAVGNVSQYSLTTGEGNTAFGVQSQYYMTNGSWNTGIGQNSQYAMTSGSYNTALGENSQRWFTTNIENTALGEGSQQGQEGLSIGGWNTAVGCDSQYVLTSGSWNTGVGVDVQHHLTSGNINTAVGQSAQEWLTTGGGNVAVGSTAQYSLVDSFFNTGIGTYCLRYATNSAYSVTVGYQSGSGSSSTDNASSLSDQNVTFIGANSGRDPSVTNATSLTNVIAIGYNAKVTNSYTAVIGGTGADAVSLIVHSNATFEGSVLAQNFESPTNTWVPNTAFGLGTNHVYTAGASTVGITGVANSPTSTERFGQLTIKATGDIVFTNLGAIASSDYLASRTITNGNRAVISVDVVPGFSTNMAIVQFK